MGFFTDLLGIFTGVQQQKKDRNWSSNEAEKNRYFQSLESASQRNWSSQEAERARDWNEEMYAKYNSLSGKIAQAEQAGVNPMLAITGNATSPMTAQSPMPSGATAGSVGTPTSHFVDLVGSLINLRESKARIDKMEQETKGQEITNESLRDMNYTEIKRRLSEIELNESNVGLVTSKILNTDVDTKQKEADIERIASQIRNTDADTSVKSKQLEVMASEIAKNTKNLDVFEAQIASLLAGAKVDNAQIVKWRHEVNALKQEFGHRGVMNKFEQMIASENAGTAQMWDTLDKDPLTQGVFEAVKFFKDCLGDLK